MLQPPKLKKLSYLIYGLGLSGRSVIRFLKKITLKNLKFGMINKKIHLKNTGLKI